MDDKMTYNKKYSLGIYENDWGFMVGSEGNPHIFLYAKYHSFYGCHCAYHYFVDNYHKKDAVL